MARDVAVERDGVPRLLVCAEVTEKVRNRSVNKRMMLLRKVWSPGRNVLDDPTYARRGVQVKAGWSVVRVHGQLILVFDLGSSDN